MTFGKNGVDYECIKNQEIFFSLSETLGHNVLQLDFPKLGWHILLSTVLAARPI